MILVSGASSFLGSEIIRQLLNRGEVIKGLYGPEEDVSHLFPNTANLTLYPCSLLDICTLCEVMEGVDAVFHGDLIFEYQPATFQHRMKYNVEGTANLVNAMLDNQVSKLIFFSSLSSLASQPGKPGNSSSLIEQNEWTTEQAQSILSAEREVWRGSEEGLQVSVVNAASIVVHSQKGFHLISQSLAELETGVVEIYPSKIYTIELTELVETALKIYYSDKYWGKRFLAIGQEQSNSEFYHELAEQNFIAYREKRMNKRSVFFKVLKDFLLSLLTGKIRTFRRTNGKRLLSQIEYQKSQFE